jgi:hypothetical protein
MHRAKPAMPVPSTHPGPLDDQVLVRDRQTPYREGFNSFQYVFRHRLADNEVFAIPRLVELAEDIARGGRPERFVIFGATRDSARTKFSQLKAEPGRADKLQELGQGRAWLKLAFAQEYSPAFRRLHEELLDEIEQLSGFPLQRELGWSSMTIMLASPGIVTPYHIDHESNFLFQIHGAKDIWLFDPRDRGVLSEEEIERYYAGNIHAADFRDDLQEAARHYRLKPGLGIHNPPLAPHWVRNGGDVSVSLSLNFSLRRLESRARVYQVNHYLRRLGIRPRPPDQSALIDWLKSEPVKAMAGATPHSLEELLRTGPRRLAARLARIGRLH